jgi:hypothetical protein
MDEYIIHVKNVNANEEKLEGLLSRQLDGRKWKKIKDTYIIKGGETVFEMIEDVKDFLEDDRQLIMVTKQ